MNVQLEGIDELEGTYAFDIRKSHHALRLNRFLWNLRLPEQRAAFLADETEAYRAAGLSKVEQDLLGRRDWIGLIRHGANFFVLEKMARVLKVSNLEVYAQMRGESFEDFLKTRQVPDAR
jgi:gallate dioxygenase